MIQADMSINKSLSIGRLAKVVLAFFLAALCCDLLPAYSEIAAPRPIEDSSSEQTRQPQGVALGLSTTATEVAKDLGVLPILTTLANADKSTGESPEERNTLRQKLLQTILVASFEIRAALSLIDTDISQNDELRSVLDERRENKVQSADVANFIQSGSTEILSTGMADFNRGGKLSVPGAIIGVVGGSLEIGISTYSARLNQGEHRSSPGHPNMLSQIFGFDMPSARFPSGVWNYLNDPIRGAVTEKDTRRAALLKEWSKLGRIKPLSSPQGRRRAQILSGAVPLHNEITIELLRDRGLMLSDLRAMVSRMDQDMLEIMQTVAAL